MQVLKLLQQLYKTPVLAFFSHTDARRYDVMRMCFALASLANIIDMWGIRHTFFSLDGVLTHYPRKYFAITNYSLFYIPGTQDPTSVTFIFIASSVFCIFLLLGLFPRISALLIYIWTISYINHMPPVLCGYDMILQTYGLLVLISPIAGPWSLDWVLKKHKNNTADNCPLAPRYGLILLQFQVLVIYMATAFYKVINTHWQDGETVFYYITSFYGRFAPVEVWRYHELLFILSDMTLIIEFSLPFLLWNKKTRWLGLFVGIGFHGSIGLLSRLSIFSIVIISTYAAFLESDDLNKLCFWRRFKK